MHILIIILEIIGVLLVCLFIAAAFSSDDYVIKSELFINKPQAEVFNYIKYLKNQEHYNKWVLMDPNVRKKFTGTDGTVGFHYAWDSDNNQVGQGEQTISSLTDRRVDYDLLFIKPFSGKAESYLETEHVSDGQTNVIWVFQGKRTYMMKVMHLAFNLKKVLKRDLQTSLNNLKRILEQA
jgi:hypothetical protein